MSRLTSKKKDEQGRRREKKEEAEKIGVEKDEQRGDGEADGSREGPL